MRKGLDPWKAELEAQIAKQQQELVAGLQLKGDDKSRVRELRKVIRETVEGLRRKRRSRSAKKDPGG